MTQASHHSSIRACLPHPHPAADRRRSRPQAPRAARLLLPDLRSTTRCSTAWPTRRALVHKAIPCATRSSSTTAIPPPSSSTSCWRPPHRGSPRPRIEAPVAIGVDEMSWDDLDETHYDWPTVAELRDYRGHVRPWWCDFIERMPIRLPIHWQSPAWVILMGIEHERIHLETSSVLIRQLPLAWCAASPSGRSARGAPDRAAVPRPTPCCRWPAAGATRQTGCHLRLGQRIRRAPHRTGPPFQASRMLVSNAEFSISGGRDMKRPAWWDDEGRGWRQYARPACPPSGSAIPEPKQCNCG